MRRLITFAIILLGWAAGAAAQTTTVTGIIVDPFTNPYSNGTITAVIALPTGSLVPSGARLSTGPVVLNANGAFSMSLASPFSYTFVACATPVTQIGGFLVGP